MRDLVTNTEIAMILAMAVLTIVNYGGVLF